MFTTDPEVLCTMTTAHRLWQGIPSIEITKNGRVFVCFYSGGTNEQIGNYAVLLMSDDGVHFSEPIAAAVEPEHRCFDPCLWIDPAGRLWFTWARFPDAGLYAVICDEPDAETPMFGAEFRVGSNVMMNKPTVLADGTWAFPLAVWADDVFVVRREASPTPTGALLYATTDGADFTLRGGAAVPERAFDEHIFLEHPDHSLSVFVRTEYGIGAAESVDGGRTWSEGHPTGINGPSTRFHIRRLPSDRLLMIYHDSPDRSRLTAFLSEDEGRTWPYRLLLDPRSSVSYPDAALASDGGIHIVYDRERGSGQKSPEEARRFAREILTARITEEEILAGALTDEKSYVQRVINRLGQ